MIDINLQVLWHEIVFKRSQIGDNYIPYKLVQIVDVYPTDDGLYRVYHTDDIRKNDILLANFDEFKINEEGYVE